MTDTITSQNTDLSSWNTLYKRYYMSQTPHSLVYHAHLPPEMNTQKMGHKTYKAIFIFVQAVQHSSTENGFIVIVCHECTALPFSCEPLPVVVSGI
jgi:hypothetical protein